MAALVRCLAVIRVESMDEEKPYAEKVDGVIVTVPSTRLTFYLEKKKDIFGERTEITPVALPERKAAEFARSVIEAVKGAGAKLKEVLGGKEVIG
jgi:hypothetical protein